MIKRTELKYNARHKMSGNVINYYIITILVSIFAAIYGVFNSIDSILFLILTLLIELGLIVLNIGINKYCLNCYKDKENISDIFFAFNSSEFINIVFINIVMIIKIFLYTCLLIIPGIIKSYEYMMIPYILADNPNIDCSEAFKITKEMTKGYKMELFIIGLSFIGWNILAVFTCGILMPYVAFYSNMTYTGFYLEQKDKIE